jgi:ectoine hydroxylase-related dioxygenase (phytanoyl-CoA dioxygenase family)
MAAPDITSTPFALDEATIASYRVNGFVHVPNVLTGEEVARFRAAAERVHATKQVLSDAPVFNQIFQVWKDDADLRELTLNADLASIATQLAGVPVRLWHDHMLVKAPHNGAATEFHQDAPYWPHRDATRSLSCWVALTDVPVERGCMTFLPGLHERRDIRPIDLNDAKDLFSAAPDLQWRPWVTIPLRAGDVTFHSAWTPHRANPNDTDEHRWAHVNIYVDRDVVYNGGPHPATDHLGLADGDALPDDEFPPLPR